MQHRYATDDEIRLVRAITGESWAIPTILTGMCIVAGFGAWITDFRPFGLGSLGFIVGITTFLWVTGWRRFSRVIADIERKIVEEIEGAPDKVWIAWPPGLSYLRLQGKTIQVPKDCYEELREATLVKIGFLPTALVAVRVEVCRGIGYAYVQLNS